MTREQFKSLRIFAGAACGLWALSYPAMGQEVPTGPGDQIFSFSISQKFSVNDNIRLDSTSVGTTYSSDTKLSFGFDSETRAQKLHFAISGVGRIVDDPVIGNDAGFRDPSLDLSYSRDSANSRVFLTVGYDRPDLAFLDPLSLGGGVGEDDFYRGAGTREDFIAGIRLETGLLAPLGFEFNLNSERRSYSNTTDPLLFSNQTNSAAIAAIFRFSPVARGRLTLSEDRYRAGDQRETRRKTNRFTFGLQYDLSEITDLSVEIGHSEVVESFSAVPGLENVTRGPIAELSFNRLMPNGRVSALFETTISERGRQNTLEFSRVFELPTGLLSFSIGATNGDSFQPRPIGQITYIRETATGEFNLGLSREVSISSLLSQATETTQLDAGYRFDVNDLSSLSFSMYYADIALIGNNSSGANRARGSFSAAYTRDITEDWDLQLGYEYRYFKSTTGGAAQSNSVFFTLQRDFNVFR